MQSNMHCSSYRDLGATWMIIESLRSARFYNKRRSLGDIVRSWGHQVGPTEIIERLWEIAEESFRIPMATMEIAERSLGDRDYLSI